MDPIDYRLPPVTSPPILTWSDRRTYLALTLFLLVRLSLLFPNSTRLPAARLVLILLAACLAVTLDILTPLLVSASIRADAIILLAAMMVIAARLEERRVWVRSLLLWGRPSPMNLLARVSILAGVLGGWITSDGVGWLMAEVVFSICRENGMNIGPFAVALATSSNIGGALILIGNPKNMLLSTFLPYRINFLQFTAHMAPAIYGCLLLNTVLLVIFYRSDLRERKHKNPGISPEFHARRLSLAPTEYSSDGWSASTLDTDDDPLFQNSQLLFGPDNRDNDNDNNDGDSDGNDNNAESESQDEEETSQDDETVTDGHRQRDQSRGSRNIRGVTISSQFSEESSLLQGMHPQYATTFTTSPGINTAAVTDYSFAPIPSDDGFSPWKLPDAMERRSLFSRRSSIVRFEWPIPRVMHRHYQFPRLPGRGGQIRGANESEDEEGEGNRSCGPKGCASFCGSALRVRDRMTFSSDSIRGLLTFLVLLITYVCLFAGLNPAFTCLTAATVLLAITNRAGAATQAITQDINWSQLAYLFSIFVLVAAVERTPVPEVVWEKLQYWIGGHDRSELAAAIALSAVVVGSCVLLSSVPALLLIAPRMSSFETTKLGSHSWYLVAWSVALCASWTYSGSVAGLVAKELYKGYPWPGSHSRFYRIWVWSRYVLWSTVVMIFVGTALIVVVP